MTFELAHVTDVHLGPLPHARTKHLLSKRSIGYISWHRKRYLIHRVEVLDALIKDIHADPPGHTAVTGDLVNIALPDEFVQAGQWLRRLGEPEDVTVIPGNHDAYSGRSWRAGWVNWRAYMRGDGEPPAAPVFPFVRRVGPLALIGLSSAVPSPLGYATGRLGSAQVAPLKDLLAGLGQEGLFRVILVHHPPLDRLIGSRRHLRDEKALRDVVRDAGAELVLSGHEHVFLLGSMPGPKAPVPVVAGPSASLLKGDHISSGGYLRYRIDPTGGEAILVELRRFDPTRGSVHPVMQGRIARQDDGYALVEHAWRPAPA
ncbi:MAG: metallophosphoesterase [Geminicoccaceae bacterium]|nr:metallophosphoesterase [Geminicoccaceae bacterium]